MMTIWKYPLTALDKQVIEMPHGARILTVQVQRGIPCLWAWVDEKATMEPRIIRRFGTNHRYLVESMYYIGTYQLGESVAYHVFEEFETTPYLEPEPPKKTKVKHETPG